MVCFPQTKQAVPYFILFPEIAYNSLIKTTLGKFLHVFETWGALSELVNALSQLYENTLGSYTSKCSERNSHAAPVFGALPCVIRFRSRRSGLALGWITTGRSDSYMYKPSFF